MDFSMNIGWPDTGACVSDRGRCYMLVKVGGRGEFQLDMFIGGTGRLMWICGCVVCAARAVDGGWMGGYVISCVETEFFEE